MTVAQTTFFHPIAGLNLVDCLAQWSLLDDLELAHRGDGTVAFIAKGGAAQWPCEWTPEGDAVVEFDLDELLRRVSLHPPME
jgi:hypothetical protein